MHIFINGIRREITDARERSLLEYLRDEVGLTGAKNGCNKGVCGACTVLIDGKPRRSCREPLAEMEGRSVETVESLSKPGELHPLQYAFIKAGAVQCGFCTTGFLMAAKALLMAEPRPEPDRIRRALGAHLCRCTGYQPIMDAVSLAGEMMERGVTAIPLADLDLATGDISAAATAAEDAPRGEGGLTAVGRPVRDRRSVEKVKGTLRYGADRVPVSAGSPSGAALIGRSPVWRRSSRRRTFPERTPWALSWTISAPLPKEW